MYDIVSGTVGLLFIVLAFKLRSPLFILARPILIGATLRTTENSFLEFSLWMLVLFVLLLILDKKRIKLNSFYVENLRVDHKKFYWNFAFLATFIFLLWIFILGIPLAELLTPSKRNIDRGITFLVLSIAIDFLVDYSTILLAFYRKGVSRSVFIFASYIQLINIIRGFLLSQRGAIIAPLIIVFSLQLINTRSSSRIVKLVLALSILFTSALILLAYITQSRRLDFSGGSLGGLSMIYSQLSSPLGNYFSPEKDTKVLDYVQEFGTLLPINSLFSGFYGLIPRVLWASKPTFVGVGPIVGTFVFGTGGGSLERGAGIPVSMPAQLTLTLGEYHFVTGVLLFGFIGYSLVVLSKKYPLLIFPFLAVYPSLMGSDIGRVQISFIVTTIGVFLLSRLANFRFRYCEQKKRKVFGENYFQS